VASARIVEALDELEHGHAGFGLRLEPSSIEKLGLMAQAHQATIMALI
jgi:hypothetical protein